MCSTEQTAQRSNSGVEKSKKCYVASSQQVMHGDARAVPEMAISTGKDDECEGEVDRDLPCWLCKEKRENSQGDELVWWKSLHLPAFSNSPTAPSSSTTFQHPSNSESTSQSAGEPTNPSSLTRLVVELS